MRFCDQCGQAHDTFVAAMICDRDNELPTLNLTDEERELIIATSETTD